MGGSVVRKYKNFAKAVKAGDFDLAANEMLRSGIDPTKPSKWYIQTQERCQRAADAMRVGYFAQYEEVDAQDLAVLGDSPLSAFTNQELVTELSRRLGS